jgi:hypothetical protein
MRVSLLGRIFRDYANAECRNPTVRDNWKNNAKEGWYQAEPVFDPLNYPPDLVSGEPGRLYVRCSDARALHNPPPPFIKQEEPFKRATANCGPDGRYWEKKQ